MTLDDRKAAILHAVVEEYIETAAPVGSGAVARSTRLNVSSATVRNEMAQLEADGYLFQPHTSAGRVPTDKGYRTFVDALDPVAMRMPESERVSGFFDRVRGEIEGLLKDTASLLSNLTDYTALVVDHSDDAADVRSVQLVGLGPHVVLAVLVLSTGAVVKHTVEWPEELDVDVVERAGALVAAAFVGRPLDQPAAIVGLETDTTVLLASTVRSEVLDHLEHDDTLYVEGTSRVASAFEAADTVRRVLTILEQQLVVVNVLADVVDRGDTVAIGTETGVEPLRAASVVVAPYEIAGEPAGSIAVLGPTRMNYQQAMAAVAVVSRQLGRRLTEG